MAINYQKTYANLDVDERMAFRDLTMEIMREIYPHYIIRPLESNDPDVIFITNRQDNVRIHFPLHDLHAHYSLSGKTRADLKDKILILYANTLKKVEDSEMIPDYSQVNWTDVSKSVVPRLARRAELHEVESYAHFPFGEDLVTAFVADDPFEENSHLWISKEMLERWKIDEMQIHKQAMENFGDVTEGLEVIKTVPPHSYMRTDTNREIAATAILLPGFRYLLSEYLGTPYRFGIPSGYILYAWTEFEDEEFQTEMKAMMIREFERLPSKLTENIYEVDDQGQVKQLKKQPEIKTPPNVGNN